MFVRSFVSLAALAAAVVAAPSAFQARDSQCQTGSISCCNNVSKANDANTENLFGLLNIIVDDPNSLVGLGCSPIVGATSCTQQPICCDNNHFNGLIVVGCSPINVF